jgi:hypothetical protein
MSDIWRAIEDQRRKLYAEFGNLLLRPYFEHLYKPLQKKDIAVCTSLFLISRLSSRSVLSKFSSSFFLDTLLQLLSLLAIIATLLHLHFSNSQILVFVDFPLRKPSFIIFLLSSSPNQIFHLVASSFRKK